MASARSAGRGLAKGIKGSAVAGLTGAAAFYGHSVASEHIEFIGSKWWSGPAIMGVGGHLLRRKNSTVAVGTALLGAAGYAAAMGYRMNKATQVANAPPAEAETGAMVSGSDDVGALIDPTGATSAGAPSSFDVLEGGGGDVGYSSARSLGRPRMAA